MHLQVDAPSGVPASGVADGSTKSAAAASTSHCDGSSALTAADAVLPQHGHVAEMPQQQEADEQMSEVAPMQRSAKPAAPISSLTLPGKGVLHCTAHNPVFRSTQSLLMQRQLHVTPRPSCLCS